jgi:hypothetical protein
VKSFEEITEELLDTKYDTLIKNSSEKATLNHYTNLISID